MHSVFLLKIFALDIIPLKLFLNEIPQHVRFNSLCGKPLDPQIVALEINRVHLSYLLQQLSYILPFPQHEDIYRIFLEGLSEAILHGFNYRIVLPQSEILNKDGNLDNLPLPHPNHTHLFKRINQLHLSPPVAIDINTIRLNHSPLHPTNFINYQRMVLTPSSQNKREMLYIIPIPLSIPSTHLSMENSPTRNIDPTYSSARGSIASPPPSPSSQLFFYLALISCFCRHRCSVIFSSVGSCPPP